MTIYQFSEEVANGEKTYSCDLFVEQESEEKAWEDIKEHYSVEMSYDEEDFVMEGNNLCVYDFGGESVNCELKEKAVLYIYNKGFINLNEKPVTVVWVEGGVVQDEYPVNSVIVIDKDDMETNGKEWCPYCREFTVEEHGSILEPAEMKCTACGICWDDSVETIGKKIQELEAKEDNPQ